MTVTQARIDSLVKEFVPRLEFALMDAGKLGEKSQAEAQDLFHTSCTLLYLDKSIDDISTTINYLEKYEIAKRMKTVEMLSQTDDMKEAARIVNVRHPRIADPQHPLTDSDILGNFTAGLAIEEQVRDFGYALMADS